MAKKQSNTVPILTTLLIIIAVIAIVAVAMLYRQDQETTCQSTCSEDFCDGFNFYSCELQNDGCKAPMDNGKIVSKCGVTTLPTDCDENFYV